MSCVNCGCSTAITSTAGPKGNTGVKGDTGDTGAAGAAGAAAATVYLATAGTYAPATSTTASSTTVYMSNTAGIAVSLPVSPVVGTTYEFIVQTTSTTGSYVITTGTGDFLLGWVYSHKASVDEVLYTANAALTDTRITINGTTTGLIGTAIKFVYMDATLNLWYVTGDSFITGAGATPFS